MNTTTVQKPQQFAPAMRAQTAPATSLERSPETDVVEKKKKKTSTAKKVGIGVAGAFIALIGTGLAVMAHQRNKIAKLYKEKLVLSNLGENLQFSEAKTVEEGIKFAKEVLKIPEVDSSFTLEAINTANRGLVDVSNANKGKLFMPRALRFVEPKADETWTACVIQDIESKNFGNLYINKLYYDSKFLDDGLKERLYKQDGQKAFFRSKNGKMYSNVTHNFMLLNPSEETAKLIEKFYDNPAKMSIMEKLQLVTGFHDNYNQIMRVKNSPLDILKKMENTNEIASYFKGKGIKIDYDMLSSKSTQEQSQYLEEILRKMLNDKIFYSTPVELGKPAETIYHEMGHLQDFAKNLKELDIAKWQLPSFREAWKKAKEGKKSEVRSDKVDEIMNRWGSVDSHENIKKLFDEKPEEFKKICPELHEFLTNKEIQQTAGKISDYAQSGIGEFIAEVYMKMISGKKISDDVMNLYKKYKGPELPV